MESERIRHEPRLKRVRKRRSHWLGDLLTNGQPFFLTDKVGEPFYKDIGPQGLRIFRQPIIRVQEED